MSNGKFIKKLLQLAGLRCAISGSSIVPKSCIYMSSRTRMGRSVRNVIAAERSCAPCPNSASGVMSAYAAGWCSFITFPKKIDCPTHGRTQERIPWADAYARVSYRLEVLILTYSQLMTQKAAAELLHLATSTFSNLLHRTITRVRDGHRIRGLKSIGIDEVSYRKGHKYVTVVYDLERACVVWVGAGKARKTIDQFFNQKLSDYQKKKIQWACCDMSETFIGAIKAHCPNAQLVLDRFHIAKALNEALDEVRKQEWRKALGEERKVLKGLRWLLFTHAGNRSKGQTRILNQLRKSNRRIHHAWVLKDYIAIAE